MEIQFFPSKTCIVHEFWHFCSHLEWITFCQNSWTCFYFLWKKLNFHFVNSPFSGIAVFLSWQCCCWSWIWHCPIDAYLMLLFPEWPGVAYKMDWKWDFSCIRLILVQLTGWVRCQVLSWYSARKTLRKPFELSRDPLRYLVTIAMPALIPVGCRYSQMSCLVSGLIYKWANEQAQLSLYVCPQENQFTETMRYERLKASQGRRFFTAREGFS